MPREFRGLICSPLNLHVNVTGRSPLLITHDTEAVSPSFRISSPNSNGVICGGTEERAIETGRLQELRNYSRGRKSRMVYR